MKYIDTVVQRMRERGYEAHSPENELSAVCVKRATPLIGTFSYVFLFYNVANKNIFGASKQFFNYATSKEFKHLTGQHLPRQLGSFGARNRVVVPVFVGSEFPLEAKSAAARWQVARWAAIELPALAETKTKQVTFNRHTRWDGFWSGEFVLPGIVKTIDDVLRF